MFTILEMIPPYSPTKRIQSGLETISSLDSSFQKKVSLSHELYISDSAFKSQIFDHISWGKRTDDNVVEQGGILLGATYHDEIKNLTYGVVEQAIPGFGAVGSPGYLSMGHETWREMLSQVDEIIDRFPEKKFQVIGWYHTHPNSLSVFMSGTDVNTQRRFFAQDWQFAIVLNPHKKTWRSFYGYDALECKGFVYDKTNSPFFFENQNLDEEEE